VQTGFTNVLLDEILALEVRDAGAALSATDGRTDQMRCACGLRGFGGGDPCSSLVIHAAGTVGVCTLKTPSTPCIASSSRRGSSMSPLTTDTPSVMSVCAAGLSGSRVSALTANTREKRSRGSPSLTHGRPEHENGLVASRHQRASVR